MAFTIFIESVSEGGNEGSSDVDNGSEDGVRLGDTVAFRDDLALQARREQLGDYSDLEVAIELVELVQRELTLFATGETCLLSEQQIENSIKALKSVLRRIGIEIRLPFRNYETFKDYFRSENLSTYRSRRELLERLFFSARAKLEELETRKLAKPLVVALDVSTIELWAMVDIEIAELRRKYNSAVTLQDFRALGTNCLGVLEAVGDVVYDQSALGSDETTEPRDRVKQRIAWFLNRELAGEPAQELRTLVNSTVTVANRVKHGRDLSQETVGMAADATVLVASMIRRLAKPGVESHNLGEVPF